MREATAASAPGTRPTPATGLPHAGPSAIWIVLVAALALCWPTLLTTAPLGYFDTASYVSDGEAAVDMARKVLSPPLPQADSEGSGAVAGGEPPEPILSIRSAAYSVFLFVTSRTGLGLVLPVILQTALTLYLLLALIPDRLAPGPVRLAVGALFVGVATTLPWFASYAMPDILVAAMVLYFAILLGPVDEASGWQVAAIGAIGIFAVLSHYANPPLALALACAVLGWRVITRRITWRVAAMAVTPVLAALAVNLAVNVATDTGPSIAPKRLPLVLARSIADGPGKWYLEEACPSAGYAICEVFDDIPDDLGTLLWSPEGMKSATGEQMARMQAEEVEILIETMKAYPLQQARALAGNAALQLIAVGTGEILPRRADGDGPFPTLTAEADAYPAIRGFDPVVKLGTVAGLAGLLVLALRGMLPRYLAAAFALLILATLVNGAMFGGLSAPVDRYQSRIAWLFPAFAVLAWFELHTRSSRRADAPP